MPSSVTGEVLLKLRDARYLTYEISHRLPARGQVIPTPEPGESVVFTMLKERRVEPLPL